MFGNKKKLQKKNPNMGGIPENAVPSYGTPNGYGGSLQAGSSSGQAMGSSRLSSVPGGASSRLSSVPSSAGGSRGYPSALSSQTIKPIREPLLSSRHGSTMGSTGGGALMSTGGSQHGQLVSRSGAGGVVEGSPALTGLPSSLPNGARKVGEAAVQSAVYLNPDGSHVETTQVKVARKVDAPHFVMKRG